jgi:hypothetical protein
VFSKEQLTLIISSESSEGGIVILKYANLEFDSNHVAGS